MLTKTILDFVDAINKADVDRMLNIMTDDHVFIDSQGNKMFDKNNLRQAWIGYFQMFPDYTIKIEKILTEDTFMCILGHASGTYKGLRNDENSNHFRIPAVWTAIIEENKIRQWQVYADNIIVSEIINRNK